MPVGFNSAARNLFLLGSSGADLITNFFKRIDQSAGTDGVYLPDEIRYNVPDQKFLLAGTAEDLNSLNFGWFEKRTQEGSVDWNVRVQSTQATTLKALEIDSNDNLIVCGKTGTVPWIAKYTNGGSIAWQVTSNTTGVEYTGIAIDNNDNIYACGSSSTQAYIEKVDGTGSYSWGKYSSNTAGAITFIKCAVNDRSEVVAVGKIEDTIKDKGYIAKVDTTTGDLLWDRTIEDTRLGQSSSYLQVECTDVYIDGNDQIYIIGNSFDAVAGTSKGFIVKYTAEGNMIWQKETQSGEDIRFVNVKSDTETEQTIVLGTYINNTGDEFGLLSKYSKDGSLVWRRVLYTAFDTFLSNVNLDADPSFYYLLFVDQESNSLSGTPDTYVFGKVSTSGNGLGNFDYSDGISTVYYETSIITDNIGRLSDGSVRQDSSDLLTYPFDANKILFDDLATQIANKKVQVDEAGTYSDPTYPVFTSYPRLLRDQIVFDTSLILNFDFSNKACYRGTVEENIIVRSKSPDNLTFPWGKGSNTTRVGTTKAPDGTDTAIVYSGNGSQANEFVNQGVNLLDNTTYTCSIWAKLIDGTVPSSGDLISASYNNGTTLTRSSVSMNGNLTTEWKRFSTTFTNISAQTGVSMFFITDQNNTSKIAIWGAQLEKSSSVGPFIETSTNAITTSAVNNLTSSTFTAAISGATFNSAGYFEFDGIGNWISANLVGGLFESNNAITVEMWIYANSFTSNDGDTTQWLAARGSANSFDMRIVTGVVELRVRNISGSGSSYYSVGSAINVSNWYHVVGIFDGQNQSNMKMYVNNTVTELTPPSPFVLPTSSSYRIGAYVGGTNSFAFDGRIGEHRIYNRVLSAEEVSQNFNATRAKYGV